MSSDLRVNRNVVGERSLKSAYRRVRFYRRCLRHEATGQPGVAVDRWFGVKREGVTAQEAEVRRAR